MFTPELARRAPLALAAVLVLVLALGNVPPAAAVTPPPGQALRIERPRPDQWVLPVTIGGRTVRMLLDSGTSRSMISAALAASLGLRPRARFAVVGPDGGERLGVCAGPVALTIGTVVVPLDCLGWVPDSPGRGGDGKGAGGTEAPGAAGADGVLAADALLHLDLLLEPALGRLRVAASGSLRDWVAGTELPITLIE